MATWWNWNVAPKYGLEERKKGLSMARIDTGTGLGTAVSFERRCQGQWKGGADAGGQDEMMDGKRCE